MTLNPLIVDFVDATLKHQMQRLVDEKISIKAYRAKNEQKLTESDLTAITNIENKVVALTTAFENAKAEATEESLAEFLNFKKLDGNTETSSSYLSIIDAAKIQRGTFSKALNLQTETLANLTSKSHLYAIKIFQQDPTITDPKTKYTTPEEANTLLNEIGNEYLGDPNWGNNNKIGGGLFSSTAQNFEEFNIEVAKNLEFLATMQKLQDKDKEAKLIGENYIYDSKNPDSEKKIIEELEKINTQIQEIKIDLTAQTKENSDILVSLKKSTSQSIQQLKFKIDLKKQIAEIAEINVSIIGAQHIEKTKDEANQKLNSLRNNIEKIIIENNSEPNIQYKKEISDLCNTASNAIKNKTTELEKNIKNALDTSQKHRNEIIGTITDSQNNQQNKSKDFEADKSKIIEQLTTLTSKGILSDKDKASVDEALKKLDVTIQEAKQSEVQAKQDFDSLISKALEKPIFNDNDIASTTKVSEKYNTKKSILDEAHITNLSQKMSEEDQKAVDSIVKQTLSTINKNENSAITDIKNEITKINEIVNKVDIENSFSNVFSLKTLDNVKDRIEQELNSRIAEIAKFDISDTQAVRTTIESHQQKLQDFVDEVKNHFKKITDRKNEISNLASNSLVTEALTSIDQTTSFSALESTEENLKHQLSQLDDMKSEINKEPPISKINISNDHLKDFIDVQHKANLAISAKIEAIENLQREIIQHKNNLNQAAQSIIQSINKDTTVGNYDVKTTNADIQKQYSEDIKKIEAMANNASQFSSEDQSQINQAIKDKLSEIATQFDITISKRNQITEQIQNDVKQTRSDIQDMGAATFGELTNSQTNLTDQIAKLESTIQTYNISEDLTDLKDTFKNQTESIADDIVKIAITNAQKTNISKLASIKEVTEHQQKTTDALKALEGQIPDNASSILKEKINTTIKTINQKSDAKIDAFINAKNTLISEIMNKALDLNARLDLALKIGDIETLEEEIKQSNENFKQKSEAIDESLRHELEPLLENLQSCDERALAKIEDIRGQIQSQQNALSALNPESSMATVDSQETLNIAKTQFSQEIQKFQAEINKFAPEDVKTLVDEIESKNNTFDDLTSKVTRYFSEVQSSIANIESQTQSLVSASLPNINLDASFEDLDTIKGNLNDQVAKLNSLKLELQTNQAPNAPSFINAEPQQNLLKKAIDGGLAKINEQLAKIAIKQNSINDQQSTLQAQAQQRLQDINNINSSKDIDVKNSEEDIKITINADIEAIQELKNGIDKFSPKDQDSITQKAEKKISELQEMQTTLLDRRQTIRSQLKEGIDSLNTSTKSDVEQAKNYNELNKISTIANQKLEVLSAKSAEFNMPKLVDNATDVKNRLQTNITQIKDTIKQNFVTNRVNKIDTKVEASTIAEAKIQLEQKSNLINQVKTKATEILSNEVSSAELGIDSKEIELKSNFNHNIQTIVYLAIAEQANKDYSNLTTFTDVEQNTSSSIEALQDLRNSLPAELSDSYTKPIIDDIQKTIEQIHQKSEQQKEKFIQQQKTMLLKIDQVNPEEIKDAKSINDTQVIKDKLIQKLQKLDISKIEPSLKTEVKARLDEKLSQISSLVEERQKKFQDQINAKNEFDAIIDKAKGSINFDPEKPLSPDQINEEYDKKRVSLNRLPKIADLERRMSQEDQAQVQPALTEALNTIRANRKETLANCNKAKEALISEINTVDLEKDLELAEKISDIETYAEDKKQAINAFKEKYKDNAIYNIFKEDFDQLIASKIQKIDELAKNKKENIFATKIQSAFRGHLQRDILQSQKKAATKIQSIFRGYTQKKEYKSTLAIVKQVDSKISALLKDDLSHCKDLRTLTANRQKISSTLETIENEINTIKPPIEKLSSALDKCKTTLTHTIRTKGLEIIKATLEEIEHKIDFTECKSSQKIEQKVKEADAELERQFKADSREFNPDNLKQYNLQSELNALKDGLKTKLAQRAQEAKEQLLMQQAESEANAAANVTTVGSKAGKHQDKKPILYGHLTGETIKDFFTKQTSGEPNYRVNINCHQLQLSRLDSIYQGSLHTANGIKILSDSGQKFEFSMDQGIPKARLAHAETQPRENETQAQTDARLADTLMTMMDNIIANGNQIRINTKSPMDAAICQQYLTFLMNQGGLTNLKASINGEPLSATTTLQQVIGNKTLCDNAISEENIADRAKTAFKSIMNANVTNPEKPDSYANYQQYLENDVISTMKKSIAVSELPGNDEDEQTNHQSFSA